MKTLKNCVKLSSSVRIYVPSTIDVDKDFDNSLWVDEAMRMLAVHFGGATSSQALGSWVSSSGQLVKEHVTIVFAYAEQSQLNASIESIHDFCVKMKLELKQEAIALEVNNELYLV